MKTQEAILFLKQNQPLPDDEYLSEELIEKYDEVRRWFMENPLVDCIPLFLNSFGSGDGFGVYQLIGDVLKKYSQDVVTPHLTSALSSSSNNICYWSSQISALFPAQELIKPLSLLLKNEEFDIRYSAITALEQIGGKEVLQILTDTMNEEQDEEIIELIEDVLETKKENMGGG